MPIKSRQENISEYMEAGIPFSCISWGNGDGQHKNGTPGSIHSGIRAAAGDEGVGIRSDTGQLWDLCQRDY